MVVTPTSVLLIIVILVLLLGGGYGVTAGRLPTVLLQVLWVIVLIACIVWLLRVLGAI